MDAEARERYAEARIGGRMRLGSRPAVLVVDFSRGFTDPSSALGSEMTGAVTATRRVLDAARDRALPVAFTTVAFERHLKDAGVWVQKMPAMADLVEGSPWVELDPRLDRRADETLIVKKGPSAFFGTALASLLVSQHADSVVLCGATTSGCVRATAIDLVQYGWPAIVPRECVADRATAPHEANLFDMDAKYVDVVGVDDTLAYIAGLTPQSGGEGC